MQDVNVYRFSGNPITLIHALKYASAMSDMKVRHFIVPTSFCILEKKELTPQNLTDLK